MTNLQIAKLYLATNTTANAAQIDTAVTTDLVATTATITALSAADFLEAAYQAAFGRSVDAEGAAYWADRMDNGMTQTQVVDALPAGAAAYVAPTAENPLVIGDVTFTAAQVGVYSANDVVVAAAKATAEAAASSASIGSVAAAIVDVVDTATADAAITTTIATANYDGALATYNTASAAVTAAALDVSTVELATAYKTAADALVVTTDALTVAAAATTATDDDTVAAAHANTSATAVSNANVAIAAANTAAATAAYTTAKTAFDAAVVTATTTATAATDAAATYTTTPNVANAVASKTAATTASTDATAVETAAATLTTAAAATADSTADDLTAVTATATATEMTSAAAALLATATTAVTTAEAAAAAAAGMGESLSMSTSQDILTESDFTSKSDTVTGLSGQVAAEDILIDGSTVDADVANLVVDDAIQLTIQNVETVNMDVKTGANVVDATKMTGVTTLSMDSNFGVATLTAANVHEGTTVTFDKTTTVARADMFLATGAQESKTDSLTVEFLGDVTSSFQKAEDAADTNDIDNLTIKSSGDKKNTITLTITDDYVAADSTETDSINVTGTQDLVLISAEQVSTTGLNGAVVTNNLTGDATLTVALDDAAFAQTTAMAGAVYDFSKVAADIFRIDTLLQTATDLKVETGTKIVQNKADALTVQNDIILNTKGGEVSLDINTASEDNTATDILTFVDAGTINIANTHTAASELLGEVKVNWAGVANETDMNIAIGKGFDLGTITATTTIDDVVVTGTGETADFSLVALAANTLTSTTEGDFTSTGIIAAAGAVNITAGQDVSIDEIQSATAGAASITVNTAGNITVADNLGTATDAGSVSLTTTGASKTISLADNTATIDVTGSVTLDATNGTVTIVDEGNINATTGITINAGGTLVDIDGDLITSTGDISVTAATSIDNEAANGIITATAGAITLTAGTTVTTNEAITAKNDITITSGTTASVLTDKLSTTNGNILINADVEATNTGLIDAELGSLTINSLDIDIDESVDASTGMTLTSTGAVNVLATKILTVDAGDLAITSATTTDVSKIVVTDGTLTMSGATTTKLEDNATTETVTAKGNINISSSVLIDLDSNLDSTHGTTILTSKAIDAAGTIAAAGDLTLTATTSVNADAQITSDAGDVIVNATTSAEVDLTSADGGDIIITAGTTATTTAAIDATANVSIAATSITLGAAATATAGTLSLTGSSTTVSSVLHTSLDAVTIEFNGTNHTFIDSGAATVVTGNVTISDANLTLANGASSLVGDVTHTGTGIVDISVLKGNFTSTSTGSGKVTIDAIGVDAKTITAGSADDSITTGADFSAIINGGAGNDTINAALSATKSVVIDGGTGNDIITGGQVIDTLTGGTGVDTFVYTSIAHAGATEVITDFAAGASGDILKVTKAGFNTLTADGATVVTVDTTDSALTSHDGTDILLMTGVGYASTAALITAVNGTSGIDDSGTPGSTVANDDSVLAVYYNTTDSKTYLVNLDENTAGTDFDDANVVLELDNIDLAGISNFTADNFTLI